MDVSNGEGGWVTSRPISQNGEGGWVHLILPPLAESAWVQIACYSILDMQLLHYFAMYAWCIDTSMCMY